MFGTPPEIELARGTDYYRLRLVQEGRSPKRPLLGGWAEEELICMAGLRRRWTAAGPVGLITSMYVIPSWRGRGIGAQLLEEGMERIRNGWGLSRFQMNVEVDNERALHLYLKHGFRMIRRDENAFTIDGVPHAVFLLERKDESG
jgi:ribosomal protein S18 acetylase RimI-like enzyme